MYDAVIFDLDGTLLDSVGDIADAANAALTALGFPIHPVKAYNRFGGDGARMLMHRALPEGTDEATLEAAVAAFKNGYESFLGRKSRPFPGILDLLALLRGRGVLLAVLSNKAHPFTLRCADRQFKEGSFDVVLGLREGFPKKPDPQGALEIAKTLAVAPERCLYVGDTDTDMKTACGAGMVPVGVSWGFRDREELARNGAVHLIDRPGELLELPGWG